jgi:hypothetical protein
MGSLNLLYTQKVRHQRLLPLGREFIHKPRVQELANEDVGRYIFSENYPFIQNKVLTVNL